MDPYWYARARASEIEVRHGFYDTEPYAELENLIKELAPLNDPLLLDPAYDRLQWYCYLKNNDSKKLEYELEFSQRLEKHHSTSPEYIMLLHRIGEGYERLNEYDSAAYYYETAADIAFSVDDWNQVGGSYFNLAYLRQLQNDTSGYKTYLRKALSFAQKSDNTAFINMLKVLNSLTYARDGEFEMAYTYLHEGLDWFEENDAATWIMESYLNLAEITHLDGKTRMAIEHVQHARKISIDRKLFSYEYNCLTKLHRYYHVVGEDKKAYEVLLLHNSYADSLNNTEQTSESAAMLNQYLNDKKILQDSLERVQQKELDDLAHKTELDQQKNTQYILISGVGFMVVLALILFRGMNRKKKASLIISQQKLEVEQQKDEIESQHQEIRDSIKYAKRIQSAILPPKKLVEKCLPDSFILYKPKDVVAGDFYWLQEINGKIVFAAADCTGHGVPGAMVSVVCNNGLNRSVNEFGLTEPALILDQTRELVIKEFEKSEEEVKDGMDIALCSLVGSSSTSTAESDQFVLQYSGANNALWIIKKDSDQVEVIAADKQPIGQFSQPQPFSQKEIVLQTGDMVYLATDGFADQFGGPKGKKFKAANFKRLLLSIQNHSSSEQKKLIDESFEEWRGNHEQVDDVCIIGVKI